MKVKVVMTVEVNARAWAADQMNSEGAPTPLSLRNDVKTYCLQKVLDSGLAREGYIQRAELT